MIDKKWSQFDFEVFFKRLIYQNVFAASIREKRVYGPKTPVGKETNGDQRQADWVFHPLADNKRGLIVELKVESDTNTGTTLRNNVISDQQKVLEINPKYASYDVVVYAIAWNVISQTYLKEASMIAVERSNIPLNDPKRPGLVARLYQWDPESAKESPNSGINVLAGDDSDALQNQGISNLNLAGASGQTPRIPATPYSNVPGDQDETPSRPKKGSKAKDRVKGFFSSGKKKGPPEDDPPKPPV